MTGCIFQNIKQVAFRHRKQMKCTLSRQHQPWTLLLLTLNILGVWKCANVLSASFYQACTASYVAKHDLCSNEKEKRRTDRGNVKEELRSVSHSLLFQSQPWLRESKSRRRSTYCLSFSVREGEETTVHSFPFKSLFLLGSQVHWEARADAGIRLQRVTTL